MFCREGMVWLDDEFRGPLHVQTSAGSEVRLCPSPDWVDALPLADDDVGLGHPSLRRGRPGLCRCGVRENRSRTGLGEALVAHRLVDAAYRSADTGGTPVEIG